MKLALGNNYSFDLDLIGYQFPALEDVEYDSNWLDVRITVRHPSGKWSAVDPALLTYEVKWLVDWFRHLAGGMREKKSIYFTEPCLGFYVATSEDSSEELGIEFSHEFSPPWWQSFDDEFELRFPIAKLDLSMAADSLERNLARFPQRTAK